MKITSQEIAEFERHFNVKARIVSQLPNPKDVRDLSEAIKKNKDGSFDTFRMIGGKWIKTGSNITSVTKIDSGSTGGSGTAGVDSFKGRIGAVSPQAGDYTASQVGLGNVTNDAQLKRSAGDFNGFTEKTSLANDDIFLIEDSAVTNTKKKALWSTILTAISNYFNDRFIPPGGTTGQALTKTSNDDYDTEWATISVGGDGALTLSNALYGGFKSTISLTSALTLTASVHA